MPALADITIPFLLLAFRLAGVFMLAPILASTVIPMRVRFMLVLAIAAAVLPTLPPGALRPEQFDVVTLAIAVAAETMIGFVIGLLMLMPVLAVQMGAVIMGQQMGFGLASVYNPALESESDLLGELLLYLALGAYIAMGGLEASMLAVLRTLEHVPLGGASGAEMPLTLVVGVLGGGFELALRVSAPLLAIIFLETVASGFIMKTVPQLNILSIGFAIKIALGIVAIVAGLAATDIAVSDHIAEVSRRVMAWAGG